MILPIDRIIIPPPTGWKDCTFYICDVSFESRRMTRRMILYSGELRDNEPGTYNKFIHIGSSKLRFQDVHAVKAIGELKFKSGVPKIILFWEDDESDQLDEY